MVALLSETSSSDAFIYQSNGPVTLNVVKDKYYGIVVTGYNNDSYARLYGSIILHAE